MADQRTGMIRFAAAPGEPLPPSPARILSSGHLIPPAGHGRLSMNRGVANPIKTSAHTGNGYLGNSP